MKTVKILLALVLFFTISTAQPFKTEKYSLQSPSASYVYICVSRTSHAYHRNRYCRGLGRCKHSIKRIPESEAIQRGYRRCRICY